MSTEREDLLNEANNLGLQFQPNVPSKKLKAAIDEAKGLPPEVEEEVPASPAMKAPEEETEEVSTKSPEVAKKGTPLSDYEVKRRRIAAAKKRAFETKVVTLTNKDSRENDVMTTAYLSFENQYFSKSRVVPLDIPVELEVALIKIAEKSTMTLHKDEVKGGKRTGNKVPVRVKKYAVSYGQQKVED
jgi:hypothetical protein